MAFRSAWLMLLSNAYAVFLPSTSRAAPQMATQHSRATRPRGAAMTDVQPSPAALCPRLSATGLRQGLRYTGPCTGCGTHTGPMPQRRAIEICRHQTRPLPLPYRLTPIRLPAVMTQLSATQRWRMQGAAKAYTPPSRLTAHLAQHRSAVLQGEVGAYGLYDIRGGQILPKRTLMRAMTE